ncbi:MAG: phosphate ABC transporter substrate-binding protein [Nitrospinota bacterium]
MRSIKLIVATCLLLGSLSSFAMAKEKITIQGSDTLLEMTTVLAAKYMKQSSGTIQVTGGGSGTGIAALINGTIDIANASRAMKKKERRRITKSGKELFEIAIALDGISIYLHKDNKVSNLTMEQLANIYLGKINNWSEVGGAKAPIIRYSRENNSGTYAFFKKVVLKKQNYAADTQNMPGTSSVVNAVSKDPNGIGYGGLSYSTGVKLAKINGVMPTAENISVGKYPISRRLFQYTIGKPKDLAKKFIMFELSKKGQKIAVDSGYVSLPEKVRKEMLATLK